MTGCNAGSSNLPHNDLALVTGGSGFVGSAVVRELLRDGFAVRTLVRRQSPRANLDGLEIDVVEGDMRDREAVDRAMQGARYVFHVAADYRLWAPDRMEIFRSNTTGTEVVMASALAAKVERVVYTSSVATLKVSTDGRSADETMPLAQADAIGVYKQSKLAAERNVEQLVAHRGLPAVIVNPSTPIGPRDIRPTPTGRIIIEAACGRMPAYVETGLNVVHVDDVARGHILALQHGRIGERYILGGENMTLGEMLAQIAGLAGRKAPRVKLARALIFPLAYVAEAAAQFTKHEPFVTVDGLRMAKYKMFFSSAKAARDLSYVARPASEALGDAYRWFRDAGYLR